jgi:hypothetical protein
MFCKKRNFALLLYPLLVLTCGNCYAQEAVLSSVGYPGSNGYEPNISYIEPGDLAKKILLNRKTQCSRIHQIQVTSDQLDIEQTLEALNGSDRSDSPFLKCLDSEDLATLEARLLSVLFKRGVQLHIPTVQLQSDKEGKLNIQLEPLTISSINIVYGGITESFTVCKETSPHSIDALIFMTKALLLKDPSEYRLLLKIDIKNRAAQMIAKSMESNTSNDTGHK